MVSVIHSEAGDSQGEDVRGKCAALMYDALAIDSNADKKILKERALAIEKKVLEGLNGSTGNDYRASKSGGLLTDFCGAVAGRSWLIEQRSDRCIST
jgi:hypothetical protein